MKIKPNYKHLTKYTEEEKTKLFQEGMIRNMSHKEKNKKVYTRKTKYKTCY